MPAPPLADPTCVSVSAVSEVFAGALQVPGLQRRGNPVTLADFQVAPGAFTVLLPVSMLKEHVQSQSVRVTFAQHPSSSSTAAPASGSPPSPQIAGSSSSAPCSGSAPSSHAPTSSPPLSRSAHLRALAATNRDENDEDELGFTGGPGDDGGADADTVTVEDIEMQRAAAAAALLPSAPDFDKYLGVAPDTIADVWSSVVGDGFHFMDRAKVPVHHDSKKGYFHALQEAFFAWDPVVLEEVKDCLRAKGLSGKDIEAKMYFDVQYFRARVPRVILPASKLYRRVRAVFELYGNKVDAKSKTPLFNKRAWGRAKNVLSDILAGFASDPPGFTLYTRKLDLQGRPAVDSDGIALIESLRGTPRTESFHKQFIESFGGWSTGVAMADYLLGERRHRHNQHSSERRRLGFPKIGHSDTWLIDELQLLVERNHGVLLYPDWSNTSDYQTTTESFGTVSLHSRALGEAIDKIDVDWSSVKLTPDQKYLCSAMHTKLPLLPVHGVAEHKVFENLVVKMPSPINFDVMAIDWCSSVNGVDVFPKLPVYLRTFHHQWLRNQRVRVAVEKAASGEAKLQALNAETMTAYVAAQRGALATPVSMQPAAGGAAGGLPPAAPQWRVPVGIPGVMTQPVLPRVPFPPMKVAGMTVGRLASPKMATPVSEKRKPGARGPCKTKRKPPTCRRCIFNNAPVAQAAACKGRCGNGKCVYECHKCSKGFQSCPCKY